MKRSSRGPGRKNVKTPSLSAPEPFFCANDIDAVHEYFSSFQHETDQSRATSHELSGRCYICARDVEFEVNVPADGGPVNWRETLKCPECGLINRWRGCLHVFEAICNPASADQIYLTETLSPVYQNLAGRFPNLIGSEYLPEYDFGTVVPTHGVPVRNEDITQLTFADESLESVLSFDVLEHVPDYRKALKEFYRTLSDGGKLILSVPFCFAEKNQVRAVVDDDGNLTHLMEPCYHGDPLSEHGVLSYCDFGMELLSDMREAGFEESHLLCYYSEKWGYLHNNVVFVGLKKPLIHS